MRSGLGGALALNPRLNLIIRYSASFDQDRQPLVLDADLQYSLDGLAEGK